MLSLRNIEMFGDLWLPRSRTSINEATLAGPRGGFHRAANQRVLLEIQG